MAGSIQDDQLVDQYKIKNLIGHDQFRHHYSAYEIDTGKAVSLSLLRPEYVNDDPFVQDYLQRTQSLTQIRHPNLTAYLQVGLIDGSAPYVTMDPVSGFPLGERVERLAQGQEPVHPVYALSLVQQTASGLALLERLDLYHHELTPNSIQLKSVTLKGEDSVIVTDLDIPDCCAGDFVEYNEYAAAYLSPEQLSGDAVDGRSHVYTLGVILHELLCGQRPQEPLTRPRELWSVLSGGSILQQMRPNLSTETYAVVKRALYKNRRRRFSSLAEFQEALGNALAVEDVPVPVKAAEPLRRPRPFFMIPVVMLLLCGMLALLGFWLLPGLRSEPSSSAAVASEGSADAAATTAASLPSISPTALNTPTALPSETPTEQFVRKTSSPEQEVAGVLPVPILQDSSPTPSKTATAEPKPTETEPVPETKTPAPTPTPKPAFRIMTSSANLRIGPGTNYDPIGYVYQDEELEIVGRSVGDFIWLNIQTENGLRGWVAADVGELVGLQALATIQAAATIPSPPTPTHTATPTETPVPLLPDAPPSSGSSGGGGSEGDSGGGKKPRPTPTAPF